jgi:hypothetical protein
MQRFSMGLRKSAQATKTTRTVFLIGTKQVTKTHNKRVFWVGILSLKAHAISQ